jgi:hypothetical protein
MPYPCGACCGDGICRNDFHDLANSLGPLLEPDDVCPACGNPPGYPGDCPVCGGSGKLADD